MLNANGTNGNNQQATLELRIYYDPKNNADNSNVLQFANSIVDILTGQQTQGPNSSTISNQGQTITPIDKNLINIVLVDLYDQNNRNSPSQKALDLARNLANLNTTSNISSVASNIGGAISSIGTSISNTATSNPFSNATTNNNQSTPLDPQRAALKQALCQNIVDCWIQVSQSTTSNPSS